MAEDLAATCNAILRTFAANMDTNNTWRVPSLAQALRQVTGLGEAQIKQAVRILIKANVLSIAGTSDRKQRCTLLRPDVCFALVDGKLQPFRQKRTS